MKHVPVLLLAALALGVGTASAQVGRAERSAPSLTEEYDFFVDYAAEGDIDRNGLALGEISVTSFGGGVRTFRPLNAQGRGIIVGLEWSEYQLDPQAGVPLPDQLRQIQLVAGLNYPINDRWTFGVYARPGLYSDFEDIGGDDVNMPTLFTFTYVQSPELIWLFGINLDLFSKNPVIPAIGLRWGFAPAWTFSLGFPRTGFAYAATDRLTLHMGASLAGGSFHVSERQANGLRDTLLDYREIRVGVSAEYAISATLKVELETGQSVDRNFDYFDRDYEIEGDSAPYVRLSFGGKF